MVPSLLLAISQPGHGSPTVSSCPQLPSSLAVPLTGSPVIVVKQVQEQALPRCFFLEPPGRATAGRAPSSMGPTWTLSGLQAGQLAACCHLHVEATPAFFSTSASSKRVSCRGAKP